MLSNRLSHTKLFLSPDTLKNFDDITDEKRQKKTPRKLLSEDDYAYLNQIWQSISIGMFLKVTYYHIDHYISIIGPLTHIDTQSSSRIKIKEKWIKINDISYIEIIGF